MSEEPPPARFVDGPEAFVDSRLADGARPQTAGAPIDGLLRLGVDAINGTLIVGATVQGDVIGQQRTEATARARAPRVRSGRVPDDWLREVAAVHVRPPYYERAIGILRRRNVVVLRGQPSLGKNTTGLRLLDELLPGRVCLVDPDADIWRMDPAEVIADRGYLINSIRPATADEIREFDLTRIGSVLRERGSYLVITADERVPLAEDVDDHLVECGDQLPDPEAMLRKHLAVLLGPDRTDARDALVARRWVRDQLHSGIRPRDVERLARVLEAVDRGHLTDAEAPERLGTYLRDDVTKWLARRSRLETWAFRIALAVCNGEAYESVLRAARLLEDQLRAAGLTVAHDLPARAAFRNDRRRRLDQARARVTPPAGGSAETVEFRNPGYPAEVLRTVWYEYDDEREALLGWLHDLGCDTNIRIRVRAAVAAGTLASFAFDYVREAVLDRWAGSADPRSREAAAMALRPPAEMSSSAPLVLATLRSWGARAEPPERQATTAHAYGSTVGRLFPDRALRGLRGLAAATDPMVQTSVVAALVELFEQGGQAAILPALVEWTDDADPNRGRVARYAFLALAAGSATGPRGRPWPALLHLIDADETWLENVAVLWRRLLNTAYTRDVVLRLRQRWVSAADRDPQLQRPLGLLLAAVAAAPRRPQPDVTAAAAFIPAPRSGHRRPRPARYPGPPRQPGTPLLAGPTPVSLLRLLQHPPVPDERRAVVFRDAFGRLHQSTVDRPVRLRRLLLRRLRARYDVDVSEQRTTFRCSLPTCDHSGRCFDAVVRFVWRVMDPRLIAENGSDVREEVRATTEWGLRQLAREQQTAQRAAAEDHLTIALTSTLATRVPGTLILRGYVNLSIRRHQPRCSCTHPTPRVPG